MFSVLKVIYIFLIATICSSIFYIFMVFPNAKLNEIIFQIQAPVGKLTFEQILPAVIHFGIPFIVITAVCFITWFIKKSFKSICIFVTAIVISFVGYAIFRLDVVQYVKNAYVSNLFIETNYQDPKLTEITFPDNKRNLIYLILESMEVTYADQQNGGYFKTSRIPELTALAKEGESFSGDSEHINGQIPLFGTTWTMGAVFGLTAGLPLKVNGIGRDSMSSQRHFFQNVTTLGDILHDNGYENVVMKGSDMTFAGARVFFTDHGNFTSIDYGYCVKNGLIPKDYYVWWGFEDKKLFEIAKEQITKLAAGDKPFNFTFFTNDTHMEDGYLSDFCPNKFSDKYSNVIRCTSLQVAEFISWLKLQPFYDNTTVVLVGDHLTMDSDYGSDIDNSYERKAFVSILNSAINRSNQRSRVYSTFDLFPTILNSLGAHVKGDRLGLGVSLYSDQPTILERYGESFVNSNFAQRSIFMEKLSQIPMNKALNSDEKLMDYVGELNDEEYKLFVKLNHCESYTLCADAVREYTNDDYVVIFNARNGVGPSDSHILGFVKDIFDSLRKFNLKFDFENHVHASYAALINGSTILEQYHDSEAVKLDYEVANHKFHVVSAGRGNYAYINIDGVEYSLNAYGINFVIFDLKRDKVIMTNWFPSHGRLTKRVIRYGE